MSCNDCGDEPCRWWCPICELHHPVQNMVTHCIEKMDRATAP